MPKPWNHQLSDCERATLTLSLYASPVSRKKPRGRWAKPSCPVCGARGFNGWCPSCEEGYAAGLQESA